MDPVDVEELMGAHGRGQEQEQEQERGAGRSPEVEQIREAIAGAHDRIDGAVRGYDATILETEPALGAWSPRDVVGHLADWQFEMLDSAEHILRGPKPRFQPIKDRQGYNSMRAAVRGTDPWDLTWRDLESARDRALEFTDRLTPEQLNAIGPFPSGEIGTLRTLLERELIRHLIEHGEQLEEWHLRRSGVRTDRDRRVR